jgi:serralysin
MATITVGNLTSNSIVNGVLWNGWKWTSPSGPTNITYIFANDGGLGWLPYEKTAYQNALSAWSNVANVTFTQTLIKSSANFVENIISDAQMLYTTGSYASGFHDTPQTAVGSQVNQLSSTKASILLPGQAGGYYNYQSGGVVWTESELSQGGFFGRMMMHELGHALGLKHPHDVIGSAPLLPGVTDQSSLGSFNLNHMFSTIMSYNRNYTFDATGNVVAQSGYNFAVNGTDVYNYGYASSPMAIDIAAIQSLYGANMTVATGSTVYMLPDADIAGSTGVAGTRWTCIWDAGGIDEIRYVGSRNVVINLTAATLDNSATGGGVLSHAMFVHGGFTIANGVVIENATGGTGNDTITGNAADNVLSGNDGNDLIVGGFGADTINGGQGNDTLDGGAGNDVLSGFSGNDAFFQPLGFDTISDFMVGGTDDTIDISALTALSSLNYVAGLATQVGLNTVITFAYNSAITLTNVTVGTLTATDFVMATAGSFNLIPDTDVANSLAGTLGVDSILGNGGNDTLSGLAGNDTMQGGDGADYLYGDGDNDLLDGGNDNDILLGGAGDDTVMGGDGIDYVFGGTGNNVLSGNAGLDIIISEGTNDIMNGGSGQNYYYRVADGASQIFGGDGLDILVGGTFASDDVFYGLDGGDFALGGGGNDELIGGLGDDILLGGNGNDTLDGGLGLNYLYADGVGNDLIRVNANLGGTQIQLIADFAAGGTDDVVQISGSNLTGFAGYQSLLAGIGTVVNGNLLQNTGVGAILTLGLGTANQTDIWFLGVSAYSLAATDFQFI